MSAKELIKRYLLLVIGLFLSGIGVAITKRGGLGVSPISSVPNVITAKFPVLSFGTWLMLWNCVLIVGQIVILRKNFKLISLLQIPLSIVFGWFTDIGVLIASFFPISLYPLRLAYVFIGTAVLGSGIALTVVANVIMNSGEAFVKAISDTRHSNFGKTKQVFDISCVSLSVIISLILFKGKLIGAREGTVIAALLTGYVVRIVHKKIQEPIEQLLKS